MEERFSQQKRYGMSIRKYVKKRVQAPPRTLPPLGEEVRGDLSKSVVVTGSAEKPSQELLRQSVEPKLSTDEAEAPKNKPSEVEPKAVSNAETKQ